MPASVIRDFGFDSEIVEMTISRCSEANTPTAHRKLAITIQNRNGRHRVALMNPEPLAALSSLMEAWAFRVLVNRAGGLEFGCVSLEYRDNEDAPPRLVTADRYDLLD